MAKVTEVTPPAERRFSIDVTEVESKLIANALLHYRNIHYWCNNHSERLIADGFRGQTSSNGAALAQDIIYAINAAERT